MHRSALLLVSGLSLLVAAGACSSSNNTTSSSSSSSSSGGGGGATTTTALFDLTADLTAQAHFYDVPYPSDLRLTSTGTPDLTGIPYPAAFPSIPGLVQVAMQHPGFPTVPVAYFAFDNALGNIDVTKVIAADKSSNILLVDIDPTSSDRGTLAPTVATVPPADGWILENVLAVAQWPGFVLHGGRKYAFVVLKSLGDANGKPLAASATLEALAAGKTPSGAKGAAAATLYQPLWDTLKMIGVDASTVAAATVFTTGDVVADNASLAAKIAGSYSVTLDQMQLNVANHALQNRYCELIGTVTYPQFQQGTPPFDTGGTFAANGSDGLPPVQRMEVAPFAISIPMGEMPAKGFPLVTYFHGSGGYSTALADRGTWVPGVNNCAPATIFTPAVPPDGWNGTAACDMGDANCVMGCNTPGEGPAYVLAPFGFAMAGSALPVNPERLPGASDTAYLNLTNLSAMRDTFRQGIIEQHLFLDALEKASIDPTLLAGCPGVTLPAGVTSIKFDASNVFAQGQSMGGMYTNLISAAEPRIRAAVPTGAGGYWSHFVLITPLIPNSANEVGAVLLGTLAPLTFLHPGMSLFETAAEAVDPMVSMPRLARRPLPGAPVRPVYEPVGQGDSYFPEPTYDAMATAYGHKETGTAVWPTMQTSLKLEGLDGILPYSVVNDVTSEAGGTYTGMVVQYKGDGVYDPHAIYSQLDAVKYQYGCFLSTFLSTGTAVVPAPAALGTPCPTK